MHDTGHDPLHPSPRSAGPARSGVPLAAKAKPCTLEAASGSFSAALLAAKDGHQDAAVLSVLGEIDLETSPMLHELMLPVLERGTNPVIVDLSEVSFMDASGVHFLVDTLRRLEDQSRRLAIVCRGRGHVHRLLALVGMLDSLIVHRSRESALTDGDDLVRSEPGTDIT